MKPSELATELRNIAAKIDASKKPDRTLVAAALNGVLAKIKEPKTDGE